MDFIIADDHVLFRDILDEYLKRYLPDANTTFVSDFYKVEELLRGGTSADLVILDYNMDGMKGAESVAGMKQEFPDVPIALMSGVAQAKHVREVLDQGAVGYFPKTLSGKDFVQGIIEVIDGNVFVPVSQTTGSIAPSYYADSSKLKDDVKADDGIITASVVGLSKREIQILLGLMEGMANKEIANRHDIQEVTVKMHVSKICQKLGAKNRTHAVILATNLGLDNK